MDIHREWQLAMQKEEQLDADVIWCTLQQNG